MVAEQPAPPTEAQPPRGWPTVVAGMISVAVALLFTFTGQTPDYFSQILLISGIALMSGSQVYLFAQFARALRLANKVQKAMKDRSDE